jgi:hypothetical protein
MLNTKYFIHTVTKIYVLYIVIHTRTHTHICIIFYFMLKIALTQTFVSIFKFCVMCLILSPFCLFLPFFFFLILHSLVPRTTDLPFPSSSYLCASHSFSFFIPHPSHPTNPYHVCGCAPTLSLPTSPIHCQTKNPRGPHEIRLQQWLPSHYWNATLSKARS